MNDSQAGSHFTVAGCDCDFLSARPRVGETPVTRCYQAIGRVRVGETSRGTFLELRAERKLGEIWEETPKAKGTRGQGRPKIGGAKTEPPKNAPPTLADIGISKKTSSRVQVLAVALDDHYPRLGG